MKNFFKARKNIIKFITLGILVLLLISLLILKNLSPYLSDSVSVNFTQGWVRVFSFITGLFPFSIFEFLVIGLVVLVVLFIILLIRALVKRNFVKVLSSFMTVVIVVLSVTNVYTLTAGFAYNRTDVPVPQSNTAYTNEQVISIASYFLDDYNSLAQKLERDQDGNVISPYNFDELNNKIAEEYGKLNSSYFFKHTPKAKKMLNSWFMTLVDISGITFMPLGEPVINAQMPPSQLPQVMSHEIAHAKGVMREGDCNFISYYVLLNSKDDYLRYCGYFTCFSGMLSAVDSGLEEIPNFLELFKKISPLITAEQQFASDFWHNKDARTDIIGVIYRTFSSIGNFFNDLYLKINGAFNGTGSYDDKVSDGSIEDTGTIDPDTDKPIIIVHYSSLQKMFFWLYEQGNTIQ